MLPGFRLFLNISRSIAGATKTGQLDDKKQAKRRLSHLALAIEEIVFDVLPVGTGSLASGLEGEGRMLEPNEIIDYVENRIKETLPLKDLNFLITAGPTHEKIDPVRYIGNSSSANYHWRPYQRAVKHKVT
jgi:phosphopantothenoylcysteine synthetase/decarboxylase